MMETVGVPKQQQPYSPHLKKVLKTYQLTAVKSLQGPSNLLGAEKDSRVASPPPPPQSREDDDVAEGQLQQDVAAPSSTPPPPPFPIQQLPILTTPDRSRSERSETVLEGESISCFVVGGERRLCLPQVLNSVLRDFTLQQINQVCDELQIYCSRCNADQLEVLKAAGILPTTAPSCGLITKTDAERLCSALLHRSGLPPPKGCPSADEDDASVRVYHECFGKCKGIYSPELHRDVDSCCIQCVECRHMFSPQRFVCHVHHSAENRTCHWGFDSSNWRAYLLVAGDQPSGHERLAKLLDERQPAAAPFKRKQARSPTPDLKEAGELSSLKKPKLDAVTAAAVAQDAYHAYLYDAHFFTLCDQWARMSAFRVWPPSAPALAKDGKGAAIVRDSLATAMPAYLSHSPPVLLHPERVVPLSESERFERTYQPNVALAPLPPQHRVRADVSAPVKADLLTKAQDTHMELDSKLPVVKISHAATVPVTLTTSNNSAAYNPEIELSTDTDDSSLDTATETGCHSSSVVDQVAAVMDALSDAKEATRSHVVELVRRLAADHDSVSEHNAKLRAENEDLRRVCRQQEERIAELSKKHQEQEERITELERRLRELPSVKLDPDEAEPPSAVSEPTTSGSPVSVITSQPSVKLEPLASPE